MWFNVLHFGVKNLTTNNFVIVLKESLIFLFVQLYLLIVIHGICHKCLTLACNAYSCPMPPPLNIKNWEKGRLCRTAIIIIISSSSSLSSSSTLFNSILTEELFSIMLLKNYSGPSLCSEIISIIIIIFK